MRRVRAVDLTGLDDAFRAAGVAGFYHALAAEQLLTEGGYTAGCLI